MIGFSEDNFERADGGWTSRVQLEFDHDDPEQLARLCAILEVARHGVQYNTRIDNGLECTIAALRVLEQRARERLPTVPLPGDVQPSGTGQETKK